MTSKTAVAFSSLQRLVDVNKEFEESQQDQKHAIQPGKLHYVLFGAPGEGKSTLIARLRSCKPPEEFMSIVSGKNAVKRSSDIVDGLRLGHGYGACTLYPEVWRLPRNDNIRFVDMPGFTDTDEVVRILVGVHNHAFLQYAGAANVRCRYLVVVSASVLEDDRLSRLVDRYFKELFDLFGVNFKGFLEATFFIITKNDQMQYDEEFIREQTRDAVEQANEMGQTNVSQFLHRFATHHIIVNYKEDTDESLAHRITELAERGVSDTKIAIRPFGQQIKILNEVCVGEVQRLLRDQAEAVTQFTTVTDPDLRQKVAKLRSDIKSSCARATDTSARLKNHVDQVKNSIADIVRHADRFTKATNDAEAHKRDVEDCTEHAKLVAHFASSKKLVEVFTFRSSKAGVFSDHTIDVAIDAPQFSESFMVVAAKNPDGQDTSMKRWAQRDSMIPSDPARLNQLVVSKETDFVLFNNLQPQAGAGSKFCVSSVKKAVTIKGSFGEPFSVHVFCISPFTSSIEFQEMIGDVEESTRQAQRLMDVALNQVESLTTQHEINLRTKADLLPRIAETARECQHAADDCQSLEAQVNTLMMQTKQKCSVASGSKEAGSSSEVLLQQIVDVLKKYDLPCDAIVTEQLKLCDAHRNFTLPEYTYRQVSSEAEDGLSELRNASGALSTVQRYHDNAKAAWERDLKNVGL